MNKLTMQFHDCHTLSQLIAATVYYIRLPLSWHIPEKYLYKDSHMETKIISSLVHHTWERPCYTTVTTNSMTEKSEQSMKYLKLNFF